MDSTNIIIPFDFPFAIFEHDAKQDPTNKLVYAVADGQFTYGPLSLFQYHNDELYSKTIREEELPLSQPCKEFYIVEVGSPLDHTIEINDSNRGRIYVKEMSELRNLKSMVLSEGRPTRRSSNTRFRNENDDVLTPLRSMKQTPRSLSRIGKNNVHTPPRSQSVASSRLLLKDVKSSGYGQRSPAIRKQ